MWPFFLWHVLPGAGLDGADCPGKGYITTGGDGFGTPYDEEEEDGVGAADEELDVDVEADVEVVVEVEEDVEEEAFDEEGLAGGGTTGGASPAPPVVAGWTTLPIAVGLSVYT